MQVEELNPTHQVPQTPPLPQPLKKRTKQSSEVPAKGLTQLAKIAKEKINKWKTNRNSDMSRKGNYELKEGIWENKHASPKLIGQL